MKAPRPKAGKHHSARQVRQMIKHQAKRRSRKYWCYQCHGEFTLAHFKTRAIHQIDVARSATAPKDGAS